MEKIFSLQHCNGKVIKELGDIGLKLIATSIALEALKLTSTGLVALKLMKKNLFANDYAPFFVVAIMVYFLLLIFYTALLDDRTIATIFPITLIYGFACVWSFGTLRILIPQSPTFAVVNMVLWVTGYTAIFAIYCRQKQGSEPPLVPIPINGEPVIDQPATQQEVVASGDKWVIVSPPALDWNGDGMVDLEMNSPNEPMEMNAHSRL